MEKDKSLRPFGFRDKLGYMFGDFGNDFTFLLSTMFLLKFYTDVMGVPAAIVGLMMMGAKFVDAVTDVTMGQVADRGKTTKKGKFAPWIRRICGPVAVASFLMYAVWFKDMPMAFKIGWMLFTYLLWGSVCYTAINIPYGSMASAISAEPQDRASLSNWRTIGSTLASLVISVILPLVVYYTDAAGNTVLSGTRMMYAALVCSVLAVICYIFCYNLTTERVKMTPVTEKFSLKKLLNELAHNRSLIGIVVSALLLLLSQLALSGMNQYIYPNYFGNAKAMSVAGLFVTALTLICSTFIVKLSSRFGKKELAIAGTSISAVSMIILFIIHTENVWVWCVFYLAANIGISFFNLTCWAMITDVIDDTEVRTGVRSDGTIYSVYSFARKVGQAVASGLTGILLTAAGYTTATAFDKGVVDNIYNITCLVPAAGFILLVLSMKFLYPLSKKAVEENVAVLKKKRDGK